MTKQILILISIALCVALLTSGTCSGPIDGIFTGWRDMTNCSAGGHVFTRCFISEPLTDYRRDSGAATLIALSFFVVFLFGLFRALRCIWHRLGERSNS